MNKLSKSSSAMPRAGKTLGHVFGAVIVFFAASCDSDGYPPPSPYLVSMWAMGTARGDSTDPAILHVGVAKQYDVLHASQPARRGTLSDEDVSDLLAHASSAAAGSLLDFKANADECKQSDAYSVDIADEKDRTRTMTGDLCVIPEKVTGEAKVHIDYFVSLYLRLTGEPNPGAE